MSINFCENVFKPRVYCSKICADGYEVTNLISSDPRQRGFMVERFIKVPVEVYIEFPCQIDLHQIVVDTCVGSQKSTGLFISTRPSRIHGKITSNSWISETADNERTSASTDGVFTPASSFRNTDSNKTRIHLKNLQYRPTHDLEPYSSWWSYDAAATAKLNSRNCSNVNAVRISIFQTENGQVPALRRLAILGEPSRTNPRSVIKTIISLHNELLKRQSHPPDSSQTCTTASKKSDNPAPSGHKSMIRNEAAIPVDFLDEITYEVMTIPMLLPSGHSIDKTTLDRLIQDDQLKGRVATDPFTGVTLTDVNKCIPNGVLKSRIDQFIMNDKSYIGPRTVGTKSDVHNFSNDSPTRVTAKSFGQNSGQACLSTDKNVLKKRKIDCEDDIRTEKTPRVDNLNLEIKSVLSGLPCYTRKSSPSKLHEIMCINCKLKGDEFIYQLPCKHNVCRICLISDKSNQCKLCRISYDSKNVQKINL